MLTIKEKNEAIIAKVIEIEEMLIDHRDMLTSARLDDFKITDLNEISRRIALINEKVEVVKSLMTQNDHFTGFNKGLMTLAEIKDRALSLGKEKYMDSNIIDNSLRMSLRIYIEALFEKTRLKDISFEEIDNVPVSVTIEGKKINILTPLVNGSKVIGISLGLEGHKEVVSGEDEVKAFFIDVAAKYK